MPTSMPFQKVQITVNRHHLVLYVQQRHKQSMLKVVKGRYVGFWINLSQIQSVNELCNYSVPSDQIVLPLNMKRQQKNFNRQTFLIIPSIEIRGGMLNNINLYAAPPQFSDYNGLNFDYRSRSQLSLEKDFRIGNEQRSTRQKIHLNANALALD